MKNTNSNFSFKHKKEDDLYYYLFNKSGSQSKLKINSFLLYNSFYKDILNNELTFKVRGSKSNETYIYNYNYGLVSASIKEGKRYESKVDTPYEIPSIIIEQSDKAILKEGNRIELIIPEELPAKWVSNLPTAIDKYDIEIADAASKIIAITLKEEFLLDEN